MNQPLAGGRGLGEGQDSYRLREKKKAGLLGRKPKPVDAEEAATPA